MFKYDFSVIVVCYEPDMQKLYQTLYSIIVQKNINYEIVIADDGSKKEYQKDVEDWFAKLGFHDYKLIMNEKNQGTVKNLLSGLEVAEGKYSKNISPGDYLYDNTVLASAFERMEQDDLKVCFGQAAHYAIEDDEPRLYNKSCPIDIKPYLEHNFKHIKRNYFMFRDYILGASFMFEIKSAIHYTRLLSAGVTYAEDTAVIAMLASGEKIGYLDAYVVWYEYGTGISTNASNKWAKILRDENKYVFETLAKENQEVARAYAFQFAGAHPNRYVDLLIKMIKYPPYVGFMIKAFMMGRKIHETPTSDMKMLNKILMMEGIEG